MSKNIEICPNHRVERETPLIWTFRFPGAEYWCPHCGALYDMFGGGHAAKITPELEQRLTEDKEKNRKILSGLE